MTVAFAVPPPSQMAMIAVLLAAAFAVVDPGGTVIASVGGQTPPALNIGQPIAPRLLDPARQAFPRQSAAFTTWDGAVWQVVITPLYVDSGAHPALLNILLAAHPVTEPRTPSISALWLAGLEAWVLVCWWPFWSPG